MSWLKAGKMKSANWISATGRRPLIDAPIDVPMICDSVSGVSMTRSSPN
jgi:hypothetical protein